MPKIRRRELKTIWKMASVGVKPVAGGLNNRRRTVSSAFKRQAKTKIERFITEK